MKACRRCGLGPGIRAIFGRFDEPRWMLVGQAPGQREIALDRPFAGPAGRRLFDWLGKAGFEDEESFRSTCYITALMKCFPGKGERGDLRPSKGQLANCAGFLEQELAVVRPRVLVPVGSMAIERFLGKRRLVDVIGRLFDVDLGGSETTVIPLPHPSGASAWTNMPEHQALIRRALGILKRMGPSGR